MAINTKHSTIETQKHFPTPSQDHESEKLIRLMIASNTLLSLLRAFWTAPEDPKASETSQQIMRISLFSLLIGATSEAGDAAREALPLFKKAQAKYSGTDNCITAALAEFEKYWPDRSVPSSFRDFVRTARSKACFHWDRGDTLSNALNKCNEKEPHAMIWCADSHEYTALFYPHAASVHAMMILGENSIDAYRALVSEIKNFQFVLVLLIESICADSLDSQ